MNIPEQAVEAGARALASDADDEAVWPEYDREAELVLTAALPHIRRAVIEELVEKYEAEAAFVLPTEVPARIEARPDWIPDDEDGAMTLNLWTDGKDLCWSTEDGDTGYTPDQVMEQFTEHRLLGADE